MRRVDWFLVGLVLATALAFVFPEPGARGGALHPELVNELAVALVFFLHGLALSRRALASGTRRYQLHLVVQLTTYAVFPVVGVLLFHLTAGVLAPSLRAGIFFLCALPSTITSSIALTAAARGDVAAAVFNATLSSLLGVVLTPLWVTVVLGTTGHTLAFSDVVLDLCRWLLLPFAAGQLARPLLAGFAARHRARFGVVTQLTLLLLIYTSFCESVKEDVWARQSGLALAATGAAAAGLLVMALAFTTSAARALGFAMEDRVAAVFCGATKTLATGVPMARLIFGPDPTLSLILLPIMLYHPLQLVVGGYLAARWASRSP